MLAKTISRMIWPIPITLTITIQLLKKKKKLLLSRIMLANISLNNNQKLSSKTLQASVSFNQKPISKTMMFCHSISSTITMMKIMIRRSILFQMIERMMIRAPYTNSKFVFWSKSFESMSNSLHCNCESAVYKVVIHKQISP